MNDIVGLTGFYALLFFCVWSVYAWTRYCRGRAAAARLAKSREGGLSESNSLYPVINPNRCLGCGSCVRACPEGEVFGIIDGKAKLVDVSSCIGHGACKVACPMDAIELVLGSAERGVEIPALGSDFQTNVPGIFVAGELGGMGLIRNAIEQGCQAVDSATAYLDERGESESLDLIVVGSGPAGLAASLAAKERGLRFLTLEQDRFGGTVAHYPRRKIVMTSPVHLPLVGSVQLRETSKEALLAFWQEVIERTGLEIRERERVESVIPSGADYEVKTSRGVHRSRSIVLAIGRRGTPRRLGVPGEDSPKVVYRLIDPEQYCGQEVLVVGGGDSAVEAALAIGEQPGTAVTLSYRGETFKRIKPKNLAALERASSGGSVAVALRSNVASIDRHSVTLELEDGRSELPNESVIVCAGGILPTDFLNSMGIETKTVYGTPIQ